MRILKKNKMNNNNNRLIKNPSFFLYFLIKMGKKNLKFKQ